MQEETVLICGAGPTGLSAALFLSEFGVPVRIIDKHVTPSAYSRAFGVNARTLTLLKPTGVTDQLLAEGIKMRGMNIWHGDKRILHLSLSKIQSKYNFMLINSQAKTEKTLAAALAKRGITVERGTELTDIKLIETHTAKVVLVDQTGHTETFSSSCILAADGAHSTIRSKLDMEFPGSTFPEPWYFYDVELETPLSPEEGHVLLGQKSGIILLRLEGNIWRVGGNMPNILENLPKNFKIGQIYWDTSFTINHRVIKKFSEGPVYFAGDAAHLHSPVGGRGMNLGIEDAFVFATLQANGRLSKYSKLRHPCVNKVVSQVERLSQMPRASGIGSVVRMAPGLAKMVFPIFAPTLGKWVLGLDHPVIPDKK